MTPVNHILTKNVCKGRGCSCWGARHLQVSSPLHLLPFTRTTSSGRHPECEDSLHGQCVPTGVTAGEPKVDIMIAATEWVSQACSIVCQTSSNISRYLLSSCQTMPLPLPAGHPLSESGLRGEGRTLSRTARPPYYTKSACSLFYTAAMILAEPMKITIKYKSVKSTWTKEEKIARTGLIFYYECKLLHKPCKSLIWQLLSSIQSLERVDPMHYWTAVLFDECWRNW